MKLIFLVFTLFAFTSLAFGNEGYDDYPPQESFDEYGEESTAPEYPADDPDFIEPQDKMGGEPEMEPSEDFDDEPYPEEY